MKKEKLIARIIAATLVVILVLGLIVPYVSAAEPESDSVGTSAAESTEPTEPATPKPAEELPRGFEYVYVDGKWRIEKTEGNDQPAVIIRDQIEGFDATSVTIFVANIETGSVYPYELFYRFSYVRKISLAEGYYVIFSNNLAWSTSSGDAYVINNNEYKYIYIGDNYDPDRYDVEFERDDEIFEITLSTAPDSAKKIEYNAAVFYDPSTLVCPEDAKLELKENNEQGQDPSEPQEPSSPSGDPTSPSEPNSGTQNNNSDKDDSISVVSLLLSALKKSSIMIIAIALCGVGLAIFRVRKAIALKKQMEEDKYDDQRID